MPHSARWATLGLMLAALAGATLLTLADARLASSQTVTLVAKRSEDPVPADDPFAGVWGRSSPVETPLSAQTTTPPKGGGSGTATVRALHDSERLYVLAEWQDESEDPLLGQQTEFSDAAALQFPVTPGETVPSFCMGDPTAPVNIWQWKAAWQADIEQGFVDVDDIYPNMQVDFYPFENDETFYPARAVGNVFAETTRTTSTDNLLAGSFGTLTQAADQVVEGTGRWRDGKWRVVFSRDLQSADDYTQFAEGESTNVAFAVWDGTSGERDGIKSVSQFMTLEVSEETVGPREISPGIIAAAVVGGVALVLVLLWGGRHRLRA